MKAKHIVTSAFVMSATAIQLAELAAFVGMKAAQVAHAVQRGNLAAVIGTKLANNPKFRDAFAGGTLEVELTPAPQPEPQPEQAPAGKRATTKSAKDWIRELLDAGGEFTIDDLCKATGKTEVNIRTMLSDLRSAKYAGKRGVFNTESVRRDGKTFYRKVQQAPAA